MNKITNSTKISQQANKFYIKYLGMKKKRILRKNRIIIKMNTLRKVCKSLAMQFKKSLLRKMHFQNVLRLNKYMKI